ncbi:Matrixin-domain-containing protein [Diplogelasinospora grovesii]|uniref:Matrixin-domain-containing protein n=1 Tax=Diplogelasinospora grovesii TaxID=303347 RepID=A0AAN6MZV9_9PEZI|nr:Matrixin-domain-containing protein [Diplogelasinospora grovesii]
MSSAAWSVPKPGDLNQEGRLDDKTNVLRYLQRRGFLPGDADVQSADFKTALEAFQQSGGLPKTGVYDEATAKLMDTPCCGYKNHGGPLGFATLGAKWDHFEVTWRVDNWSSKISNADAVAAFNSSFGRWATVTPLTFRQVFAGQPCDIRIRFATGNHGDGANNAFDGVGKVLAHAWGPGNGDGNIMGDAHFDDAETWTLDYLSKVSLHEFGHSLGLDHSSIGTAVMYAYFNNQPNLQPDDITGIQSLYGPRAKGWFNFTLDASNTVAHGSDMAAVSRIKDSMEVWWIAPDGSVQDAYWYAASGWKRFQLAPAGSATAGGITAVSRIPGSMEVWWVSPSGSVEGAYWYEGGSWQRYQLAPAGSAARGSRITSVSRIPGSMELWWAAPNGSVQDAYWYVNQGWKRFELAGPGSAAVGSGIKAISRIPTSMELWWISPDGAVRDAYWYDGAGWRQFELAPKGSAGLGTGIAATHRIPGSMEIWWVAPNGSVQDAYWYDGQPWRRFELAGAGTAKIGGIEAVSRIQDSMEVWCTGPDGSVQDFYWYGSSGAGWQRFQLGSPGTARPGTDFGVTSRIPGSMEIWFAGPTGATVDFYWYG